MAESQNIEYKQSWRDEYLKWICGFANASGGKIYIGVDDNAQVVGVSDAKRMLEDIPNKIVNYLGIVADVNLLRTEELEYIEISVYPSNVPISYKGTYHYRSGSTKQELKGYALQNFLLKRLGRSWDDFPCEWASFDDIDKKAVDYFFEKAYVSGRLPADLEHDDIRSTFLNLGLLAENGKLKNATLLLFAKHPSRFFPMVQFKIGRFGEDDSELLFQDVVEGNILQMGDKVMSLLKSKYLRSFIRYKGLQRIEELEVPEEALREAIFNAIIHKDYTGAPIQLSVYEDKLMLWNGGCLPDDLTIEMFLGKHPSRPHNKNIADIFFKAGFIEAWGRGISKIVTGFQRVGLERPLFEFSMDGLWITMPRKQITTQATTQVTTQATTQALQILKSQELIEHFYSLYVKDNEYTAIFLQEELGFRNRAYFRKAYLLPLLEQGILKLKYPDKPNHPEQRYLLAK